MNNLLKLVANLDNLFRAWSTVRSQVRRTGWPHLISEMAEIEVSPLQFLRLMHQQLEGGHYRFSPKWAYAKRKSGGSRRGITVQCLRDRIVQRSILNVLFSDDPTIRWQLGELPKILNTSTSFAGVPGRGVPEAIKMAQQAIRNGAKAFAYSDMKDFFPCVPRQQVVDLFASNIQDAAFVQLFHDALETEIQNRADVEAWLSLFPIAEIGVAQGSLLSTLVGNLALRDFDSRMNDDQVVTIRYLDDFLILTPDTTTAVAGFERAQQELAQLGMSCYVPDDGSHKAGLGHVSDGIPFLGCQLHPDGISPARSSWKKLLSEISQLIAEGKRNIRLYHDAQQRRRTEVTYIQTLAKIDRKIRGWGDVYRFVSNRLPFSQIDEQINQRLDRFQAWYYREQKQTNARVQRRMLGVSLLADTPVD